MITKLEPIVLCYLCFVFLIFFYLCPKSFYFFLRFAFSFLIHVICSIFHGKMSVKSSAYLCPKCQRIFDDILQFYSRKCRLKERCLLESPTMLSNGFVIKKERDTQNIRINRRVTWKTIFINSQIK